MNIKQIASIVVFAAGIFCLGYGFYALNEMSQARSDIDTGTHFIPENPASGHIKNRLHAEVDQYNIPVAFLNILGAALVIAGGYGYYLSVKKK